MSLDGLDSQFRFFPRFQVLHNPDPANMSALHGTWTDERGTDSQSWPILYASRQWRSSCPAYLPLFASGTDPDPPGVFDWRISSLELRLVASLPAVYHLGLSATNSDRPGPEPIMVTHLRNVIPGPTDVRPSSRFRIYIHHPRQTMFDGTQQPIPSRYPSTPSLLGRRPRKPTDGPFFPAHHASLTVDTASDHALPGQDALTHPRVAWRGSGCRAHQVATSALEGLFEPLRFPFGLFEDFELFSLVF